MDCIVNNIWLIWNLACVKNNKNVQFSGGIFKLLGQP